MCYIVHPRLSEFDDTLSIGASRISATCNITNKTLIINFTGPPCQGHENAAERHFKLLPSTYVPMLNAIGAGKIIQIKGLESPADNFVQLTWGAVAP